MAAWAGWAKVKTLLVAAGATLDPPITMVERGFAMSVPTDQIRFWYSGNVDSPFGSDTLTRTQDGIALNIEVFLRMGGATSQDAEAALDERLEEADAAIQSALFGDAFLGDPDADTNTAIGLRVEDTDAGVDVVQGQLVRVLTIPVVYAVADRHVIAR